VEQVSIDMLSTRARLGVVTRSDARSRLLAELADGPARKAYAIAYDLLGNRAEAEEAVQEALARACEAIGDLRDPAAAPGWYLRIVTTMCLRTLRRRKLRRALLGWLPGVAASTSATAAPAAAPSADLPAPREDIAERMHGTAAADPEAQLAAQQALRDLLGRMTDLSAQQRAALVLRYGHDLPVGEIAEMLGVELATAKTHLVRGLARLRDLMEEHR
jgi:RNA polymerase sigma-70 factor (ECF subfamily)